VAVIELAQRGRGCPTCRFASVITVPRFDLFVELLLNVVSIQLLGRDFAV
jgi:hypothetical protein